MSFFRRGGRALRGARGVSMVEILITMVISVIAVGAIFTLFLTARQGFDYGVSQAYVQRQGTLLQEQIARWAKDSAAIQVVNCGGNVTNSRSAAIQASNGTIRCIYQNPEGADTDANLFVCQVATWTGACVGGTNYNMLTLMPNQQPFPLRVRNTTFTGVTCIDPGPCGAGAIALSVTSSLVNVRFDLTDNTIPNPQFPTYVGMRFGFGITARN